MQIVQIFSRKGEKNKTVQVLSKCLDEPQSETQIERRVLAGSCVLD